MAINLSVKNTFKVILLRIDEVKFWLSNNARFTKLKISNEKKRDFCECCKQIQWFRISVWTLHLTVFALLPLNSAFLMGLQKVH